MGATRWCSVHHRHNDTANFTRLCLCCKQYVVLLCRPYMVPHLLAFFADHMVPRFLAFFADHMVPPFVAFFAAVTSFPYPCQWRSYHLRIFSVLALQTIWYHMCLLCRRYGTTCLPYSSPLYYWHIFSVLALQTIWYHMFAILISTILLAYFFCALLCRRYGTTCLPYSSPLYYWHIFSVLALQTIWYHMFAILISAILLAYFSCACFADDMVPHVCHTHLRYTTGIFFLCLLCRRYGTTCLPYSSPLYYWQLESPPDPFYRRLLGGCSCFSLESRYLCE